MNNHCHHNCTHEKVTYCKDCKEVYCESCKKTWKEPCTQVHYVSNGTWSGITMPLNYVYDGIVT